MVNRGAFLVRVGFTVAVMALAACPSQTSSSIGGSGGAGSGVAGASAGGLSGKGSGGTHNTGGGGASAAGHGGNGGALPSSNSKGGNGAAPMDASTDDADAAAPMDGSRGGAGGDATIGTDTGTDGPAAPTVAACTPGLTIQVPFTTGYEISCDTDGTGFPVPNGAAVYGKTYVLPSPLIAGADNALSFELTGWGPFNFELWGTNTVCKAEELLWWGPFAAGTQCAQFKPSKAFTNVLFVYRKMYKTSYSFGTPSTTMCPGGTCPMGTTGTGKLTSEPLSAPVGNYQLNRFDRLIGGWDITMGLTGRMTTMWMGDAQTDGTQALGAGVFRMPGTDPYGDAWYCIGDGSTIKQVTDKSGFLQRIDLSLKGVARLGECGETAGTGSLTAAITPSMTTGTYFAVDITGSVSAFTGTGLPASASCSGPTCNFRFKGSPQQHFVHVATASADLGSGVTSPVPTTSATWLMRPDDSKPFSMACSTEGTVLYTINDNSKLQLTKVTTPRACPGTPIADDRLDFTIDPF